MLKLSRFDIRLLAGELRESLEGAIVRAANVRGEREFAVEFRGPGRSMTLLFDLDPNAPAVVETGKRLKIKAPQGGSRFVVETARALGGTRVEDVRQVGYERHLVFTFDARRQHAGLILHFLAFSPRPNLVLTTPEGRILTVYQPTDVLQVGETLTPETSEFVLPPEQGDWAGQMRARLEDVDGKRTLARLANDAGLPKRMIRHLLPEHDGETQDQERALETLRARLLEGPWAPVVLENEAGKPELHPFLLDEFRDLPHESWPSVSAALEASRAEGAGSDLESLRQQALSLLNRELKQERRKYKNIQQDLEEAEGGEQDKLFGDLLLAYGHDIAEGAASAEVPDPSDPDSNLAIPLDENLSATDNAQEYYDRYKRRKRKGEVAGERVQESARRVERLEQRRDGLEQAEDDESLRQQAAEAARDVPAILELLREGSGSGGPKPGKSGKPGKSKSKKKQAPLDNPYSFARLFFSSDDFRLLVGKDARGNDELSKKVAHGNDLWFHVESGVGSHVIVKRDGHQGEIPQNTLMDAALLAAHYSGFRGDTRAVVHWTEAKYVRKPKGLPPGKVLYSQQRTIMVGPDDKRLERLHHSVEERKLRDVMG